MKQVLLFCFALLAGLNLHAQIEKIETYQIGTQIDYYIGECGNEIPEAQGKLSFCDRAGNLGVVEKSLGLNERGTERMITNLYNDTEVYVTRNGVSMYKSDGTWENIPNVAFQNPELDSYNNDGAVTDGVVLPDGKLILYVNGAGFYIHTYDLLTKELTLSVSTETTGNGFPAIRNITYDTQTGKTYVFMISGGDRYLYEYTGNGFTLLNDSNDLFPVFSNANVTTTAIKDGILYVGGPNGLFTIDLQNPSTITKYDATDTGLLPFNRVNDFEIADDGMIWLAQQATSNNAGGVTKFDIINETYEVYTQENPGASVVDILPNSIALNADGRVHITISNYAAIADLVFTGGSPVWTFIENADFDALGVPITYTPDEVYIVDGKIYYITNDFSSGTTDNYEVVIRDGNDWTGRNDDAPGNISFWMARRFQEAHPTNDGGSWWLNEFDDIIVRVDGNNNLTPDRRVRPSSRQGAIDTDNNYVGILSPPMQGSDIYKVISPTAYKFASENNGGARSVAQYNDQIWVFNKDFGTVEIYIDNGLVQTYDIDPAISLTSYFRTAVDSNGIFWSVRTVNGTPSLIRFDRATENTTEIVLTSDFGTVRSIFPAPDGGIWLLSNTDAILYKDGLEYAFPRELLGSGSIQAGTVDTNGKLHVLNSVGAISTIENPTDTDPIIESTVVVGNAGLLPSEGTNAGGQLLVDANGDYWIKLTKGLYKLVDNDTTPYYRTTGITKGIISGRLYVDLNENGTYDDGEQIAGQGVAINVNGEVVQVITNADGVYKFFTQEENTTHKVILTTLGDEYFTPDRIKDVTVTSLNQNYENNDFVLFVKDYESLLFKTGDRVGSWGFDRPGFENTFTTAVTNMSATKTFTELDITYLFVNKNGGEVPEILNVVFTKLDGDGLTLLHSSININPRNNRWSVNLSPSLYTSEEVALTFTTTEAPNKREAIFTIPEILPRDTWMIEIKTAIFNPANNGTVVGHNISTVNSPDFNNGPNGTPPGQEPWILFPEEDRDFNDIPLSSEDANNPYIDPLNPEEGDPFVAPKDIYAPPAKESPIFSSYDPNDKLVAGGNALEVNETDIARKWLTYTIRFENQGNFSAKDVYILDELDDNILPDSFTLLEASDDVEVDFLPSGENVNPTLRFSFNDIFLPFDDESNDGWVKFRVRVKEDIAENTIVNNTAAIYFDQNPAIITNTIQNLFKTPEVIADTEAPTMVCKNITIFLDANGQATIVASDVDEDSTDNEGIVSLEVDITSFDCSNLGENEVILTATDAAGNSASCAAIVTVEDEFPPAVVCRDPFTISLDENGVATITVSDIDNGSTDNCGIESLEIDVTSFDCSNLGENTVTLTATDTAGFAVTCTTIVTVIDDVPPVAICQDITLSLDANGAASLSVDDINNGSFDNCSSVGLDLSKFDFDCGDLGTNTVTLFVTDAAGNASTCEATVTVVDEIPPTAICDTFTVALDENGVATITPFDVDLNDSTDNCSDITRALSQDTFTCDNLGTNEVTLTTTDASGNLNSCIALVTVVDTIVPVLDLTSVPEDQTIFADEVTMGYTMEDFTTNLLVTDNCDVTITQDPAVGTELPMGTYTVTFTITDTSGNTITESFELFIDKVLGLENNLLTAITIYPNPVQEILNVDSQKPINSLQLYDMLGRLVKQEQLGSTMNVSDLPQAMYLLKVTSDQGTQTFQVIKR